MNLILNHEGFENNLLDKQTRDGGVQYAFKFENGYGASVVKTKGSYGFEKDLWELAVLEFTDTTKFRLIYDTNITSDVEGYLSDEEVRNLLEQIKNLENSPFKKIET